MDAIVGTERDGAGERFTRRDAIRRAAALGAVAVWAAPAVQRLGQVAAFAQSPLPTPPPPPEVQPTGFPSNVQLVARYQGALYGFKFDEGDGGWDRHPDSTDQAKQCLAHRSWSAPSDEQIALWNANATVTKSVDANGSGVYTVTIPSGYNFIEGYAKCGQDCPAGVRIDNDTYSFSCG
ncbi:MAG: hypothetical protein KY462_06480 [Actinobacteria bacterium]|nr:hypothetical protein [Actinomycetota bacterium]